MWLWASLYLYQKLSEQEWLKYKPMSKDMLWHEEPLRVAVLYILIAVLWFWRLAPQGLFPEKAALVLAVIGAGMALGSMQGVEKLAWLCLLAAFLYVTNSAIDLDRNSLSAIEETRRIEETRAFASIGKGIEASISDSDRNFNATIGKTNEVLGNITGGKSFGFVVPQAFGKLVPLLVWNNGDKALTGVTITIARTQEADWGDSFYKPIFIGTIGPHDHAPVPLPHYLAPEVDEKSGEDHYWIMIAAQNGTVSESLYFRKDKRGIVPWAYSYRVEKQTVRRGKINGVIANIGTSILLLHRDWSDEKDQPH
jgi:hypothetical protein